MKKIYSVIIIFIAMVYLAADAEAQSISQNWLKTRRNIRLNYKSNIKKIIEFDAKTLVNLEKNSISKDLESSVAELLQEIITDDVVIDKDNPVKAFDILQNKFQDKKFYFQAATDVSFHHGTVNPFLTARIIRGLKELLESTFEENLKALKIVFQNIKTPYIIKAKNEPLKYGSEAVVTEIIAYIREYLRIIKSGKKEMKIENDLIIKDVYEDLSLEQSPFSNLPGAKELISEY